MLSITRTPASLAVGAVLALLTVAAVGQDQEPDSASAQGTDVLKRIRDAYAECESYRDEGEVTTVFVMDDGRERTDVKPFTTAFVRPDRFRFEFRDRFEGRGYRGEENLYVVWTDEEGVHSWWTVHSAVTDWEGVSSAIGAAAGVSGGSSWSVPRLLMPEGNEEDGLLPSGSQFLGQEVVDGLACYKVENPRGTTLWFDKEELLLRRTFSVHVFEEKGFSAERTTTYSPEFNVEITDAELSFEPPPK